MIYATVWAMENSDNFFPVHLDLLVEKVLKTNVQKKMQ